MDDIRKRIEEIEFLPTLPHIVGELMMVIEDPMSSASDLARHMDPSIMSEVLKVANSAYFGRNSFRRIGTIEQAVATIGYSGLSYIVLQMPFASATNGPETLFDRKAYVRHSLTSGILAKTVSTVFSLGDENQAYISGMLHDVGVIIMYQYFKEEWQRMNTLMEQEHLTRLAAEKEVFSLDHAHVGAILLHKWDIPETISEAVRLHHSPTEIGDNENAYVTYLANVLAKNVDLDNLGDFDSFFKEQRDLLQSEMPDRYLLKHQVEMFETAFDFLKGIERFFGAPSEDEDDQSSGS
jgi:putative nucleotidyltransferase with HDIG domain